MINYFEQIAEYRNMPRFSPRKEIQDFQAQQQDQRLADEPFDDFSFPATKSKTDGGYSKYELTDAHWKYIIALCAAQCTEAEIASKLNISISTLSRLTKKRFKMEFDEFYAQKRKGGFASLRHKQYETAMSGSVPMQIWLGKQWLNQSDKIDERISSDEKQEVKIVYSTQWTPGAGGVGGQGGPTEENK